MIEVRDAVEADSRVIAALVTAAFGQPHESRLVEQLIRDGDCAISLVAQMRREIVGHVLASPLRLEPAQPLKCLAIAPLAVLPAIQRRGAGSALMWALIERARADGVDVLFLLGNPGYYRRFGFRTSAVGNSYGATSAFQSLELTAGSLTGVLAHAHYAPAFTVLDADT